MTEKEAKAEELFNLIKNLKDEDEKQKQHFINIGEILNYIKKNKLYFYHGTHIKDWLDFLKDIGISYTEFVHMSSVRNMVTNLEDERILQIPLSRLKQLSKISKTGKDLEEMIEKALSLPIKDWNDEVRMAEGLQSYLTCDHSETEEFQHCKKCGRWIKV